MVLMMSLAAEMLKPTEAAVVARVSVRDVNRVIDERILPETLISFEDGRRVLAAACGFVSFYFGSADRLTADERVASPSRKQARCWGPPTCAIGAS